MAMTYVDALNVVIPMVEGEVAEKLVALRERMARKSTSSKPTKTQVANEGVKEKILEVLLRAGERMTCGAITSAVEGDYSSQKISALLRQLVEGGKVVKTMKKKVAYFELA